MLCESNNLLREWQSVLYNGVTPTIPPMQAYCSGVINQNKMDTMFMCAILAMGCYYFFFLAFYFVWFSENFSFFCFVFLCFVFEKEKEHVVVWKGRWDDLGQFGGEERVWST